MTDHTASNERCSRAGLATTGQPLPLAIASVQTGRRSPLVERIGIFG